MGVSQKSFVELCENLLELCVIFKTMLHRDSQKNTKDTKRIKLNFRLLRDPHFFMLYSLKAAFTLST